MAFHALTKHLPNLRYPFAFLTVSYAVAAIVSLLCCIFAYGVQNVGMAFRSLNSFSILIGLTLFGVEIGSFYVYHPNSPPVTTHLLTSMAETMNTVEIGFMLFKEKLSLTNAFGLVFGITKSYLVTRQNKG